MIEQKISYAIQTAKTNGIGFPCIIFPTLEVMVFSYK